MAKKVVDKESLTKIKKKGTGFISEFKEFILRGNVVDMAIGVIIGTAFSGIIKAFTNDFINPLINGIGGVNVGGKIKIYGGQYLLWGDFITEERLRFDFPCDHKMTEEEKAEVENLVNEWIQAGLDVRVEEMKKEDAVASGAECMFIERYPDIVTVYTIGDNVSKELCGGPHVKNTKELGHFKIKKEESSSSGVRRIKAILESE